MKVIFFVQGYESIEYEVPDETSDVELERMADRWLYDNIVPGYEIIEDRETY